MTPQDVWEGVVEMELQFLSIGDMAFVGVPGGFVNEFGLETRCQRRGNK